MKQLRKKIIILCMLTLSLMLTACGAEIVKKNDKLQIVCTLFPQYDWIREIVGDNDNIELILLADSGDLHNYQPSADDIITISSCDMFIYCGGVSDKWVEDTLKQATNKDMVVINMLEVIGDKALLEEIAEGMEEHEHQDEHTEENNHQHETDEYDEHIWLSISNSKLICQEIYHGLCTIDEDNQTTYEANLNTYIGKLDELDGKYKSMIENATTDTILVADRFPFRYLTAEYNINYYAAFVGCSSETEASFETVKFLANKLDELELSSVVVVDGSTQDVAKTVIESSKNKNQTITVLDSMQAVGMDRIKAGDTYLSIMEKNYSVLEQILKD